MDSAFRPVCFDFRIQYASIEADFKRSYYTRSCKTSQVRNVGVWTVKCSLHLCSLNQSYLHLRLHVMVFNMSVAYNFGVVLKNSLPIWFQSYIIPVFNKLKWFMLFHFLGRYIHTISLLSCFAGGVFMGTGLLDLLPEVNELMSKVLKFIYIY